MRQQSRGGKLEKKNCQENKLIKVYGSRAAGIDKSSLPDEAGKEH